MKIIDLINAKNAFDLNSKFDSDMQLAFKVIKFVKKVETESEFYNKKYYEIIQKYAEKDSEGNVVQNGEGIKIKSEDVSDFNNELEKLNDVDVEKPVITFSIDELNKCDLTGNGLYALYPFISE